MSALQVGRVSPRALARMAGLFELLEGATAAPGQFVLFGTLVVAGDAATTAGNILANATQFQLGVAANLVAVAFHLAWVYLMYELLKPVSRGLSLFAVFVGLIAAALQAVAALVQLAPLVILNGGHDLGALTSDELQGLAFLLIGVNARAYNVYLVFFGLWSAVVGYLIYRSTFLPPVLGALEALAGLCYMTQLWPPLASALSPWNLALAAPGELGLTLWLLAFGVNAQRWKEQASTAVLTAA